MRYFKKIPFAYPQLASLVGSLPLPTEIEEFIANISKPDGSPAVRLWFQPGAQYYGKISGDRDAWRDIASGELVYLETGVPLEQSAAINAQPSIALDGTTAFIPLAATTLNQAETTFMFVFKPSGSDTTAKAALGPNSGSSTVAGAPTVLLTTTGLSTYFGGAGPLRDLGANYLAATAKLVTITLSPIYGVSIRRNGVEVARDPTRVMPLSTSVARIYGQPGTGSRPSGDTGHVFFFDVDMSQPEYIDQLTQIEQHYMSVYGIAMGT